VPGGLSWRDALGWLGELAASGKRVVGVDLCEVNPGATPDDEDSWDAIVGARLLYKLIGSALRSRRTA
jgi:agmatinase